MARTLSANLKRALFSAQSDIALIALLELSHPTLSPPIRVANDALDVISQGLTYQAFPFLLTMASDDEGGITEVKLQIDAVDGTVIEAVRSIVDDELVATFRMVTTDDLDFVEIGPMDFELRDVEYDAASVVGTLTYQNFLDEPFPSATFTPTRTPGVFL